MGRLAGIARREARRAPMEVLEQAEINLSSGVAGDFRGRPGPRQVTVLSTAAWDDACEELGSVLPWTLRRANLLVEGLDLRSKTGWLICIGSARLRITGEVDPCSRMDEQHAGLREALIPDWRGGVSCTVVSNGFVAVGDAVEIATAAAAETV